MLRILVRCEGGITETAMNITHGLILRYVEAIHQPVDDTATCHASSGNVSTAYHAILCSSQARAKMVGRYVRQ